MCARDGCVLRKRLIMKCLRLRTLRRTCGDVTFSGPRFLMMTLISSRPGVRESRDTTDRFLKKCLVTWSQTFYINKKRAR